MAPAHAAHSVHAGTRSEKDSLRIWRTTRAIAVCASDHIIPDRPAAGDEAAAGSVDVVADELHTAVAIGDMNTPWMHTTDSLLIPLRAKVARHAFGTARRRGRRLAARGAATDIL